VLAGLLRYGVRAAFGLSKIPRPVAPQLPPPDRDFTKLRDAVHGKVSVAQ
jgi:hypothetical protein